MTILSTSAGAVAYDSHGSGDPIVLLPSGGHEHHDYDEIRELLPGGLRSIGVDWPGHGRSPSGTAPSTELRLTQIVEELLDSLTPAGAVLVGNSVGGNVAARLAIRRPDLVNLPEHDLRGQAGAITVPTVLIWGRHDPVLPLRAAETARDLIPGSRLVVIESGHLPHTTSPAAVAAELTSLANTAFDVGSRTNDTQYTPPDALEQEQS
jgi:pimeloyl-ACP methyl ester carboxylesterase